MPRPHLAALLGPLPHLGEASRQTSSGPFWNALASAGWCGMVDSRESVAAPVGP